MLKRYKSYQFGERPESIDELPRNSTFGTVVDEVGVYEPGSGKEYWKVIQRIETGDSDGPSSLIRIGYYAGEDGDWSWSSRPLMLEPAVLNELYAHAVSNGIVSG